MAILKSFRSRPDNAAGIDMDVEPIGPEEKPRES